MAAPAPRQHANSLEQHALAYARAGWHVVPLRRRDKEPLTPHGFKDATTDAATIRRWWSRWPDANIGIAVPAGYVVLDIDSAEALQRLKAEDVALPATSRARTSKGWHLWFSTNGASAGNRVGLLPGVDIRAAGGYVVAPPSVHPSGVRYRWEVRLNRSSIAECPEWLLKMLSESDETRGASPEQWFEVISQRVPEGRRNETLAKVAGLLFRRLPAQVAAELAYCWARERLAPPLPDREVRRTIESIAGREVRRREGAA